MLAVGRSARPRAARRDQRARRRRAARRRSARRSPASSSSPRGRRPYAFRHALLREVAYDDLLPGRARRRCTAPSPRALERRAERRGPTPSSPSAIAHHHARGRRPERGARARASAPPTRPRPSAPTARPPALLERALELWERVPDAARRTPGWTTSRSARAGRRVSTADGRRRSASEPLLAPGARRGRRGRSTRAAPRALLASARRAQWHAGRGEDALESSHRGLDARAAPRSPTPSAATLLAWWAQDAHAPGPLREAIRRRARGRRHRRGAAATRSFAAARSTRSASRCMATATSRRARPRCARRSRSPASGGTLPELGSAAGQPRRPRCTSPAARARRSRSPAAASRESPRAREPRRLGRRCSIAEICSRPRRLGREPSAVAEADRRVPRHDAR